MVKLKKKYSIGCYCGEHNNNLAYVYKKKPHGEMSYEFNNNKYFRKYFKCKVCDHHFSSHNLDLSNLYKGNYISSTYGDYEGLKKRFLKIKKLKKSNSDNFYRTKRIEKFISDKNIPTNIKMLDIGSGLGIFPFLIKKKIKNISLIETDNLNVLFLKKYLKFENVYLNFNQIRNKKFDFITLNKVLEHIEKPNFFLKKYFKLLNKNGYFYIEVPDNMAKIESYLREEFYIEHHHVFSISSLENLICRVGGTVLRIERIRDPSGKFTLFCFGQL